MIAVFFLFFYFLCIHQPFNDTPCRGCLTALRSCLLQEMLAEAHVSPAYFTTTLAAGADSAAFLEAMTNQAEDYADVCCQVPREAFNDGEDMTTLGTTSLRWFSGLVAEVYIDAVVKVICTYKKRRVDHLWLSGLFMVGFNCAPACSCSDVGYPVCTRSLRLSRSCGTEFGGVSVHRRCRSSCDPWSIESAGLSAFGSTGGLCGGFTDDSAGV